MNETKRDDYTQSMRQHDHASLDALIEKQRAMYQQLEAVSQEIRVLSGKMHDHAAGFRHAPKACTTCAVQEGLRTP